MVVSECVCERESSEYSFEGVCSLEQNQGPQAAGFRWGELRGCGREPGGPAVCKQGWPSVCQARGEACVAQHVR